jgi:hypothetical protein
MHSFAWRPLEDSRWRQAMMAYFGCFVPMCWVGNQASSVCCSTTQTASCATIRMLAGLERPDKMPCSPCLSEGRGSWRQERTAGAMEKAIVHSTASKREYTATCQSGVRWFAGGRWQRRRCRRRPAVDGREQSQDQSRR